jgi:hypothetical protein
MPTVSARIKCKIDTAANWTTNDPVLLNGEMGVESDTHFFKVGDGTTAWSNLAYMTAPSSASLTINMFYEINGTDYPCVQ